MKNKNLTREKLEELVEKFYNRKQLAEFFGVSTKTISNRMVEFNLHYKKPTKERIVYTCKKCGKQFYKSKYYPYCCKKCTDDLDLSLQANAQTDLGKQIVALRLEGKTYSEIKDILNCSKATISYYCSPNFRDKKLQANKNIDPNIRRLARNISAFKKRSITERVRYKCKDFRQSFRVRVSNFVRNWEMGNNTKTDLKYGYKEVLEHIGGWETKCYLTGRKLDLRTDEYELDHIVPISKGGSCLLDNLGITCRAANQSKSNLTIEEYLSICKEVLENFGYKVEKI